MIIGITGPTGAGKSTVCEYIESNLHLKVINCDEYARRAVCDKMLCELVAEFGEGIMKNGELDRKALAKVAFATKDATEKLNKITHPYIVKLITENINEDETVILDAPTLFESGLNNICNKTVCVLANGNLRSKRIVLRDNLTQEQLSSRQNAVKPNEYYTEKTDYVIYNNGSLEELLDSAREIFKNILED